MPDPHLRAADTDREAVATALGAHMAAGRLTLAEYDERVAQAWAARTYGELARLTADLPAPAAPAAARAPTRPPCGTAWSPGHPQHGWQAWWTTSVTVLVVYLAIALASWELHYFWPAWVIGPWGAALLARTVAERGVRSGARG